ncbi:hypothetical protein AEQU1_00580 [Aequorivita sp. CIP111184]|nr:hypothetical protein AEQU1_00580 [Aequorivita sp. CIP111184]
MVSINKYLITKIEPKMILLAISWFRLISSGFRQKSHKSKLLDLAKKISGFVPAYLLYILKSFYCITQKFIAVNLEIIV